MAEGFKQGRGPITATLVSLARTVFIAVHDGGPEVCLQARVVRALVHPSGTFSRKREKTLWRAPAQFNFSRLREMVARRAG